MAADQVQRQRRRQEGAPRWMVTFADLMALLFALFVLLLSFADMDPDTFRRNAGPISQSFGFGDRGIPLTENRQFGEQQDQPGRGVDFAASTGRALETFRWNLRRAISEELASGHITLHEDGSRVTLRFPSQSAFELGSAELSAGAIPSLSKIARVLAASEGTIFISGHTDDHPISSSRFRSNWDLSSARAVSVLHHLMEVGNLESHRLTAQGFAESRPLVANDSPGGRRMNRRVEITLEITGWKK